METLRLLFVRYRVLLEGWIEKIRRLPFYLRDKRLFRSDFYFFRAYRQESPYAVSKRFLIDQKDPDPYRYGETRPISAVRFIREVQLHAGDSLLDLGSGTGQFSLWLHLLSGCTLTGIERIPLFVDRGNEAGRKAGATKVRFLLKDIEDCPLEGVTVVYFYGTNFDEDLVCRLAKRLSLLPVGTKIVTTSYSLLEIDPEGPFAITKRFSLRYPWGRCTLFLHEVSKTTVST